MKDISKSFGSLYHPFKAIILYKEKEGDKRVYAESYDMSNEGYPVNAHPLSVREGASLAKALDTGCELEQSFLQPAGLLPKNLLYMKHGRLGYALWHTPAMRVNLLFKNELDIPSGKAAIPELLWLAGREQLNIYALKKETELEMDTPLYHAPFFNVHPNGNVCMGTVNVDIHSQCSLELFMQQWQEYFFNSYFSHLIQQNSPVKGNIIQLWQSLVGTKKIFPQSQLVKNGRTIKNLIR
ncbi:PRTRC system protein B [Mucilaginibacter boryungensis]|uniref:PRTRC system protein B n=1 Tax=Mucilaginibacter boryungensis TaxID=768480 RepID=A0ABR9XL44_9SPHI|nr:PRTRC system protein B [Mucilaginibacter boryungensis]MBE9668102.1 PRTRC system protein B [Mucilaginibacter boryungensis]